MAYVSCAVGVTIFSNGSIIPPSFKFTELHALTPFVMHSCRYTILVAVKTHFTWQSYQDAFFELVSVSLSLATGYTVSAMCLSSAF